MKNQGPNTQKNDVNAGKNQTNTPNQKPTDTTKHPRTEKEEKEFDTLDPENELTKTDIQNNGKNDARTTDTVDPIDSQYEEDEEETPRNETETPEQREQRQQRDEKPIGNKTMDTEKPKQK